MDALRKILATIGKQMSTLTVTQRLLIGSLVVLLLMTMFLVSQYAGAPKMVELIPTGTAEDQQRVAAHLDQAGVPYVLTNSKVTVLVERRYPALAQLARAQLLPGDKKMMFAELVGQQNWLMSQSQLNTMNTVALSNELAAIVRNFPGVEDANVIVSNPEAKGIGTSYRKPVAQVTVFTRVGVGSGLDQGTVNALADLVAGSTAGMDARDVAIIDGTSKRSYRATAPDEVIAGNYMEHVGKVESRVREKIQEQLQFIDNVIVSVNAIVDASKRSSRETKALDRGSGTVVVAVEESGTTSTATNSSRSRPGEPGLGSNVAMDVNTSGASGGAQTNTADETTTVKSEVRFGERTTTQVDATGKPTKINVTVSVPREYMAELVRLKKGSGAGGGGGAGGGDAADATDDEIKQAWDGADGLKAQLEQLVTPLVETEGAGAAVGAGGGAGGVQVMAGTVRAFLIPAATGLMSGGRGGGGGPSAGGLGGSGGMMSTISSLSNNGLVKTGVLGLLAVVALGLMVAMVKKSAATQALPTAEELVGIPPTLQSGGDIVGEADEGETAMTGIEVDADALKTGKMLEEIGELVKSNPASAAGVFNKWMSSDN